MLEIKEEFSFEDLKNKCWSGALNTLERIEKEGKESQLMNLLNEVCLEVIPTMTEVNNYLWFEDEDIFECLEIESEDEEEE